MKTKKDYIAVFDSGVGGISVLRHLHRRMPRERYVYYGDCANAPYGSRSTEDVRRLALAAARHLTEQYPVKALVVACNTATAAAIEVLRREYPDLIVVGIEPALKLAADRFPGGRIGVMATQITLREEKFDQLLHRFPDCRVEKIPAPGLVELIEAGKAESPEAQALLHSLLDPYQGQLDALVLGSPTIPSPQTPSKRFWGKKPCCWTAVTALPSRLSGDWVKKTFWKRKVWARSKFTAAAAAKISAGLQASIFGFKGDTYG